MRLDFSKTFFVYIHTSKCMDMLLTNGCKHVLFISLILFKIKECAVIIPRANQLIIILSKVRGEEQVSSYIFVLWCKWEKKLRGIIKMSLAFHLKKTQEMIEVKPKKEEAHHHIHTNRTSRFLFYNIHIDMMRRK